MTKVAPIRHYASAILKILAAIIIVGIFIYVALMTICAHGGVMFIVVDSLLLAPLSSFILLHVLWKHFPNLREPFVTVCVGIMCFLIVTFHLLHIQFVEAGWNFCVFAFGYFTFCLIAAACWRFKNIFARISLGLAALAPIAAGYYVVTCCLLSLFFMLGDYIQKPLSHEKLDEKLVCERVYWGNVGAGSGIVVEVYRTWPGVSFIRQKVARLQYDEGVVADKNLPVPNCNDVLAGYKRAIRHGFSYVQFNLLIYLTNNYNKERPRKE